MSRRRCLHSRRLLHRRFLFFSFLRILFVYMCRKCCGFSVLFSLAVSCQSDTFFAFNVVFVTQFRRAQRVRFCVRQGFLRVCISATSRAAAQTATVWWTIAAMQVEWSSIRINDGSFFLSCEPVFVSSSFFFFCCLFSSSFPFAAPEEVPTCVDFDEARCTAANMALVSDFANRTCSSSASASSPPEEGGDPNVLRRNCTVHDCCFER